MTYDSFAVSIAIKYCSDTRKTEKSKAPHLIEFSFLTLEGKTKCSQRYLDFKTLQQHGNDVENQARMAKEKPDIWFKFSHEAIKKTDKNGQRHTNGPKVFYYQGNKSKCLTSALASAIEYFDHRENNMWRW